MTYGFIKREGKTIFIDKDGQIWTAELIQDLINILKEMRDVNDKIKHYQGRLMK